MDTCDFIALLDLVMCSDPWPVKDDPSNKIIILNMLNRNAKTRGFSNWIEAYHNYCVPLEG